MLIPFRLGSIGIEQVPVAVVSTGGTSPLPDSCAVNFIPCSCPCAENEVPRLAVPLAAIIIVTANNVTIISEVSVTFVTFFITNTVQIFYKRVELETCHDAMWIIVVLI